MATAKKKTLVKPAKKVIPSLKLFLNDDRVDRVRLSEWTLPNDKTFSSFLRQFDEETKAN